MWFIYDCIALASPVGLWLARKGVTARLHAKPATAGDDLGWGLTQGRSAEFRSHADRAPAWRRVVPFLRAAAPAGKKWP